MKNIKIKLESITLGFCNWKVFWNLNNKDLRENPGNSEYWATLVTFLFIPLYWKNEGL